MFLFSSQLILTSLFPPVQFHPPTELRSLSQRLCESLEKCLLTEAGLTSSLPSFGSNSSRRSLSYRSFAKSVSPQCPLFSSPYADEHFLLFSHEPEDTRRGCQSCEFAPEALRVEARAEPSFRLSFFFFQMIAALVALTTSRCVFSFSPIP